MRLLRLLAGGFIMSFFFAGVCLAGPQASRGVQVTVKDPAGGTAASLPLYRQTVAIIIGIDVYQNLPVAQHLSYAVKDAKGVEQTLRERYRFDRIITLYNKDATQKNIMRELLDELQKTTGEDDGVFVYFAGHGITRSMTMKGSKGDVGFLVPYDGSFEEMSTNISMQQIKSDVSPTIPAKHVFFVVDACFGGVLVATRAGETTARRDAAYLRQITGEQVRQVLTAGGQDETVLDGGPGGHSVFTGRFIEALEKNDDYLTAKELGVSMAKLVYGDAAARRHTQKPLFGEIYGTGDFVFVPDTERKKQQAEAEVKGLESELAALQLRQVQAAKMGDAAKQREIEREKLLQEAALQQAKLREEAARQETALRHKAEEEAVRNAQALKEREKENELRLASLKLQAQKMKETLKETQTAGYSLDAAVTEVKRINAALAQLDADFERERKSQFQPIDEYCTKAERLTGNTAPRDPMFETEAQYQARLAKGKAGIAKVQKECDQKRSEVEAKIGRERDQQKASLTQQVEGIIAGGFPVPREQLSWKLVKYDPEQETFNVSLTKTQDPAKGEFIGRVRIPREEAKLYWQDQGLLLLQAEMGVLATGVPYLKTAFLQGPGEGKQFKLEGLLLLGRGAIEATTGMEFVPVPGGCYQMGDTFGDGRSVEKPVHEVCVDSFYIGKYEVTQGQWESVMGNNPSSFKKGSNYPVEQVSWNDAQQFIQKLNAKSGKKFRLPTQAEWEYAARSGGKAEKYAGGNDVDRVAWYNNNSGRSTHPVGTKSPNGLGIYDMSGNVQELCQDWYAEKYYASSPRNNPQGPSSASTRVIRGGSWVGDVRSAAHYATYPSSRDSYSGFRLVLPVQ